MSDACRRIVAALLLFAFGLHVTGCTHWVAYQAPPEAPEPKPALHDLRVTLLDSTKVELVRARVVDDFVIGISVVGSDSVEQWIATEQVASLEVRKPNAEATVGLVLGITIPIVVGFAVLAYIATGLEGL